MGENPKSSKRKEELPTKELQQDYQMISQKKPYMPESHEGKDLHPTLSHPAKLSFRMEGQIKCFPDKVKLKEFIITKALLHEMLKGLI